MPQAGPSRVTPREREVFVLAAQGYTAKEIGKSLGISPRTVEAHRRHIKDKLGLNNQSELVLYAVRNGFLEA